ncbi:hypothetical protein QR680_015585 [Steinernema hermaphroditum]|uniref:G-protein coupled receptors family 1 profile domain-containing protein n=1 Tax=Steinernema hermaphroditum TaxID=289476 RepID=A0AA39H9D1_9BILA|nr:hypothetical protein QR680_015585 [Steinernema hermaphroditum]
MPEYDTLIVGVVYSASSAFFLLLYITVLWLFLMRSSPFKTNAYKIMVNLGVADCCQLLAQATAGIFTLADDTFSLYFNKVAGGILQFGWIASGPLTFILAVNRLFSVLRPTHEKSAILPAPYKGALAVAWFIGALFFASYMTPFTAVLYFPETFAWGYDAGRWSDFVSNCELYAMFTLLTLCGVIYVIIFARLYRYRKQLSQPSGEVRILVQALIISVYTSSCLITWHTYQYFLPDTKVTQFCLNIMNIINPSINPIIYLALNPRLRKSLCRLMSCKRPFPDAKVTVVSRNARQ